MKYILKSIIIILFISLSAFAKDSSNIISNFQISNIPEEIMKKISYDFEIHSKIDENTFEVYVLQSEKSDFFKLAPNAKLLEFDIHQFMKNHNFNFPGYRKFAEVNAYLKKLESDHPNLIQVVEFDRSKNGKPQIALKFSDNVKDNESETEKAVIIDAATHGDEFITTEVLLGHLENMIDSYHSNTRIKGIIDNLELYIIPVVSPDSFQKSRYVHGVDPNRAYPGPTGEPKKRVTCIDNIIKFYDIKKPIASINWHGATNPGMIMYPWGYTKEASVPNKKHLKTFEEFTGMMAAKTSPRYKHGQISKVIYQSFGVSEDYFYMKKPEPRNYQTFALGIEVGSGSKKPRPTDIPKYVKQTYEMTLTFLEYFSKYKDNLK